MASRKLLTRGALAALTLTLLIGSAEGAGPWKGQILDRETGQPIPGAVVVAVWRTPVAGLRMHSESEFLDVDEMVSDADGRFVIPERARFSWRRFARVLGPQVLIFKSGCGLWQFRGTPASGSAEDTHAAEQRLAAAWDRFAAEGAVLELPRVTDPQKRLAIHSHVRPLDVPDDRIVNLLSALEADRSALGLPPPRPVAPGDKK